MCFWFREHLEENLGTQKPCPDAPCMEDLSTFGSFMGYMLVNIPYMKHMAIGELKCACHMFIGLVDGRSSCPKHTCEDVWRRMG